MLKAAGRIQAFSENVLAPDSVLAADRCAVHSNTIPITAACKRLRAQVDADWCSAREK